MTTTATTRKVAQPPSAVAKYPPLVRRERPLFHLNWKTFPAADGLAIAERLMLLICRRRIYYPQGILDDIMGHDELCTWGMSRRDEAAFRVAQKKALAAFPDEFAHWRKPNSGGPLGQIPGYRVLDNLTGIGAVLIDDRTSKMLDFAQPGPLYKLFETTLPPEFEAMWKVARTYISDEAKRRYDYWLSTLTRPKEPAPDESQPGAALPHEGEGR